MTKFICFIDKLPPSNNHIYASVRGRKILTKEAKQYKSYCYNQFKEGGEFPFTRKDALSVELIFCCNQLINKGWPKTKNKFRRWDVQNQEKLILDTLEKYSGIDDSTYFDIILRKRETVYMEEGVWITVTVI